MLLLCYQINSQDIQDATIDRRGLFKKSDRLCHSFAHNNQSTWKNFDSFGSKHKSFRSKHKSIRSEHKSIRSEHKSFCSKHKSLRSKHKSLRSEHKSFRSEHKSIRSEHKSILNNLLSGIKKTYQSVSTIALHSITD
jgi:uncharacterized coiled-coil DUF342 family protein